MTIETFFKKKKKADIINIDDISGEEEEENNIINEENNIHVSGLLGNSACWRYWREDNIDELKKVLDPETLFEENQW